MIMWVLRARDIEIAHLMEFSPGFVSALTTRLRKVVAKDYLDNLPVFKGVVEIDIKNFVKRKIEIGKSKAKQRWVLIICERERKLTYMEAIEEKKFSVIMPIILKRVEIGSVIITEAFGVYGRLENYGFPHYYLDYSQGFGHITNVKIHISNVYGQWAWIKYAVKRYNRISSQLSDFLIEFL